jgi:hypothetical protein
METGINLQESLLEFTQLQDKIKKEQNLLLDPTNTGLSLDSSLSTQTICSFPSHSFPTPQCSSMSQLPSSTTPHSASFSLASSLTEPMLDNTVKCEPTESIKTNTSNTLLKQCLQDTTFQTKYNLKPFDFGLTTGFVTKESPLPTNENIKTEPSEKPLLRQVKIEPVVDLAVEQVKRDIETTCEMLSISPGM